MRLPNLVKYYRRRQLQAHNISQQAEEDIDKFVFRRFNRLFVVRRFIGSWLIFWLLLLSITSWQLLALSANFQTIQPVPGGIYNEGDLGTLTNANPIYASGPVDTSLSKLIFAGLLTYNSRGKLIPDLASSYSVNPNGTVYTFKLKPDLTWQDGQPLTANDVAFTIAAIQNPDAQSPLLNSWQGIKVSTLGSLGVKFTLPNPLASFPYDLTVGILPEHLLAKISPDNLRSASFNTNDPIGAGPFAWNGIGVSGNTPQTAIEQIALTPFKRFALGRPKLNEFILHAYAQKKDLLMAYTSGQINAVVGLGSPPSSINYQTDSLIHSPLLEAGNYIFFNINSGSLSDLSIRQALVAAANPSAVIAKLGYFTKPVNEPLLIGQLAYTKKYAQQTNKLSKAAKLLTNDGWTLGRGGYRYKNGKRLEFNLVAEDNSENRLITNMLSAQWQMVGVKVDILLEPAATYNTTVQDHNYDATLNGISIGQDPDVYVYWDGSQYDLRSTNLNFSEYNNPAVNQALEAGRTRLNPALRTIKYQPFLADWQHDAPALGLYQPRALYVTRGPVYGLVDGRLNSAQDRFINVQNWEILTAGVTDPKS